MLRSFPPYEAFRRLTCFVAVAVQKLPDDSVPIPFRRPSVGAAQGGARHGCRARSDGTGMSLRDDPRSGAGGRGVLRSKTRMQGWPSFWLLFLGHSRKSDSPSRAKPMSQPPRQAGVPLRPKLKSFAAKAAPTTAQYTAARNSPTHLTPNKTPKRKRPRLGVVSSIRWADGNGFFTRRLVSVGGPDRRPW